MKIYSPNITGSLLVTGSNNTITGSLTVTQGITGSLFGTASWANNATNIAITNDTTTNATYYPVFVSTTSGNTAARVDSSTLTYNPSIDTLTVPIVNSSTAVRGGNGSAGAPAFSFSGDANTGIFNAAADTLGFSTGGSEKMRLYSNGSLGINNSSSPQALLHLGATNVQPTLFAGVVPVGDQSGGYLTLYTPTAGASYYGTFRFTSVSTSDGDSYGNSTFYCNAEEGFQANSVGSGSGAGASYMYLTPSGTGITVSNSSNLNLQANNNSSITIGTYTATGGAINLLTRGTSSLYIDTAQRVGIRTTSPQSILDVGVGSTAAPTYTGNIRVLGGTLTASSGLEFLSSTFGSGFGWRLTPADIGGGETPLVFQSRQNTATWTERLRITSAGAMGLGVTPTNTAGRLEASNDIVAYSSSDKNWKKNIKNIDSPLEKLSQINGVEFDWIEDEPVHGNKGHDIGVIAQEIEQVLPEIVQTRESGMKAVQYDKIIPLLIESIKEQQKQIDELKQIINAFTK